GQLVAQLGELADQVATALGGVHPAEPDARLGGRLVAPQGGVASGEPPRHPVGEQRRVHGAGARAGLGAVAGPAAADLRRAPGRGALAQPCPPPLTSSCSVTLLRSSSQLAANLSTPSRSSVVVTSS